MYILYVALDTLIIYTHYLHMYDFPARKVKYVFQDVICQYWLWVNQVNFPSSNALEMVPCLPIMHAKAHTWPCQVSKQQLNYICNRIIISMYTSIE